MLLTQVSSVFKKRRDSLAQLAGQGAFVFPGGVEMLRNPDVHFPFRQESCFFYLTGLEDSESCLVLAPDSTRPGFHRSVLFIRPRDAERELWEGERYGVEGAARVFGTDETYPFSELESRLPALLKGAEAIYYRLGLPGMVEWDQKILGAADSTRRSQGRTGRGLLPFRDPAEAVGEMRLFKDSEEIELIRRACQISSKAHAVAMKETRPGMNEFEIEALIDFHFRKNSCQRLGYPSIVAGGKNATCLHYRANNDVLNDGELLLIDAGGEYGYYTADITRTFPIGREFSKPQTLLYDLVLTAQKECIRIAKPGIQYSEIHKMACELLADGLLSLGLLKGSRAEVLKNGGLRRFYPHGTGHWLGMDVHDSGLYMKGGESRRLEPGMVFTIEPGLYVQPSDLDAPAEFRNIGIRIEDDVLVTETGVEVLSRDAPKERSEILQLRAY